MAKLSRGPKKARALKTGTEAWWYENAKSIDVYVYDPHSGVNLTCRIRRAQLEDWLNRTRK